MKNRYSKTLSVMLLLTSMHMAFAQLEAPKVEAVYGGRINAIEGMMLNADTSRIVIATESANSLFYADINTLAGHQTYGAFQSVPGVNADDGYGSGIQIIAVHESSGHVYFVHAPNTVYYAHPEGSGSYTAYSGMNISAMKIIDDTILLVDGSQLFFGTLDAMGVPSWDAQSPINITTPGGFMDLAINPLDSTVYVFTNGAPPTIEKSSDRYDALSNSTTFSSVGTAGLGSTLGWVAFGIAPDGRLFLSASDMMDKTIAYSDDDSSWVKFASNQGGVTGPDFAFTGDSASYTVYHAIMYNHSKGDSTAWETFGNPGGSETHPNDGSVYTDPINADMVYMTTDQGIGVSEDQGETIFEIDDGVEAVQVNDFDQTDTKMTGWLASKSGIRRVDDYLTGALWTNAIFPNGDGSPYYSVAMDTYDSTHVYVGNVRVYKTEDEGSSWMQVFTPEDAPYSFPNVGTQCLALEVLEEDHNVVFAGFSVQATDKGGVFYSHDAGASWDQLLLEETSVGPDVDVTDIAFNIEGSDTVAYISVEYDLSATTGYSVYRAVKSGASWTAAQNMDGSNTAVGYVIVVTLNDLEVSVTGDTVYAVGTDAGTNHPTAYYKPINSTNLWTVMPLSGFPIVSGAEGTAVTIGQDTVYVAVANEIYSFDLASGTSWDLGYSYPVGTRINMLFYDELLAGTDLGFYGHNSTPTTSISSEGRVQPTEMTLYAAYPNPFNPSTQIHFDLPADSQTRLTVYNILGEQVATLHQGALPAGQYQFSWDGTNDLGQNVSAGLYLYRLDTEAGHQTRKMMLLK